MMTVPAAEIRPLAEIFDATLGVDCAEGQCQARGPDGWCDRPRRALHVARFAAAYRAGLIDGPELLQVLPVGGTPDMMERTDRIDLGAAITLIPRPRLAVTP